MAGKKRLRRQLVKELLTKWRKYSQTQERLDEELKIIGHPEKDFIVSVIGDPNYLITFSDINKVGINPKTKFNTPAGIYGWHFNQNTIDGAKKNELFATGRKFGHLMKIKDGAKVLWLGDDDKTGGVPSREEINAAIAGKYPAFTEDTFPIYNLPSGPPGSNSPPKKMLAQNKEAAHGFVTPQEWLEDPKHVETLSKVSQREYGGSTESEKLYDYVQAAAKALEIATDKKITLLSNGILRALGYDAVIDANGAGIIHKAEKEQGFFTHRGALDHVVAIPNRAYMFRDTTLYKLLREPRVPMAKKAEALKMLLDKDRPTAPGADARFAPSFNKTDVFDTVDFITADKANRFTPEMMRDILAWVEKNKEESPLMAGKTLENLYSHPDMPTDLIKAGLKKIKDPDIFSSIILNPNAPKDFLMGTYLGKIAVPADDPQMLVLSNPNVPEQILNFEAARYAGSKKVSEKTGRYGQGNTSKARRAAIVTNHPKVTEDIFNKITRKENGEIDMNTSLMQDTLNGKNVPMSYYRDILDAMYNDEIRDYTADNLLFSIIRNPSTPEDVVIEVLKNYEKLAGLNNWRITAQELVKFALRSRLSRRGSPRPSNKFLTTLKDTYFEVKNDPDKFVTDENTLAKISDLFKKLGSKVNESHDFETIVKDIIKEVLK